MEDAGLLKLHESSPTSILSVTSAQYMLYRIPLMSLFRDLIPTLMIPHQYSNKAITAFQHGKANTAGRSGSNVYKVNPWLRWFGANFGRGKSQLGRLTVSKTEEWRKASCICRSRF